MIDVTGYERNERDSRMDCEDGRALGAEAGTVQEAVPAVLEAHPAAQFFPLMGSEEFESFKADIAKNGMHEPIWMCEGRILDGRNRFAACQALGIEPEFRTYTGSSPIAFAWSLNGERRHLTNAQRSAIGVEMLPALKEEARKRQLANLRRGTTAPVPPAPGERDKKRKLTEAVGEAARIVGASGTNIQIAKAVKERDPATFQLLKSGEINVTEAYRRVQQLKPPRNQPKERRHADIRRLANEGNRSSQIAEQLGISAEHVRTLAHGAGIKLVDDLLGHTYRINVHRVIEETVSTLEGLALGLKTVDGARLECRPDEAQEWVKSIDASWRVIGRLRKILRGHFT